jgi:hypothetical protein
MNLERAESSQCRPDARSHGTDSVAPSAYGITGVFITVPGAIPVSVAPGEILVSVAPDVIPIAVIPGAIPVSVARDVIPIAAIPDVMPVSVVPVPIARAVFVTVPDVMPVSVVPVLMARWPASAPITVDDGDRGVRAVVAVVGIGRRTN